MPFPKKKSDPTESSYDKESNDLLDMVLIGHSIRSIFIQIFPRG